MSHDRAKDEIPIDAMTDEMPLTWIADDASGFVRRDSARIEHGA